MATPQIIGSSQTVGAQPTHIISYQAIVWL